VGHGITASTANSAFGEAFLIGIGEEVEAWANKRMFIGRFRGYLRPQRQFVEFRRILEKTNKKGGNRGIRRVGSP